MFTDEQSQDAHADRWKHTLALVLIREAFTFIKSILFWSPPCACMFHYQMLCWYEGLYFCVMAMKDKGVFYAFLKSQRWLFNVIYHILCNGDSFRRDGKKDVCWRFKEMLLFKFSTRPVSLQTIWALYATVTFKSQFNHLLFEVLLVFLIPVATFVHWLQTPLAVPIWTEIYLITLQFIPNDFTNNWNLVVI